VTVRQTSQPGPPAAAGAATPDAGTLLRSRRYVLLLVLSAVIGVPISAIAYAFLGLIHYLQEWTYQDLPPVFGYEKAPTWWAMPLLGMAGLLVGLTIRYLPGRGGHVPAEGFKAGTPQPRELPGIILAALIGLGLGTVLGPEAPLIALGGGLAFTAAQLLRRNLTGPAVALIGVTGSFAAVSTLLGSPIIGAFLLMEMIGLAGPMMAVTLMPGLLSAGIGSLVFIGLGDWTGLGPLSLAIPDLPPAAPPTVGEFGWAIAIGLAAALLGTTVKAVARSLEPLFSRHTIMATPVAGVAIGLAAFAYATASGHVIDDVLFSGQDALGPLINNAGSYSASALLLLVLCKGLGYCIALASFRGGPIFPALLIGAAGGLALSHLPGLSPLTGAAAGIAAMSTLMLRFPLTSVLLPILLFGADAMAVTPTVIVAAVVAYVAGARLDPPPPGPAEPTAGGQAKRGRAVV
jgi:H+/Cl- antiporter ClcA